MKKLNITKEQFNRSNYFQRKYGKLEYVSESGKLFKTSKGKLLKFVNEGRGLKFMDDMVAARKAAGQDYETRMSRGREAYDAKLDQDIPGDFDLKTKEEIKTLLPSMRRNGFTLEDIVDAYENGVRPNKCERKNGALYVGGMDGYFVDVDEYISLLSDSKKVNEAVHKHETDVDVPVTEQEQLLCKFIEDEIEGELNEETGLELTCGCSWHNPGEEQHIEIFVGIPEGDDPMDPKYENIETFLEQFVNKIGDAENDGEKWGDASFQWISDEEIFGELWPLDSKENKVMNESMDDDMGLIKLIKKDPTEFALAVRSLMGGLVQMGNESGLVEAINGISNREISKALFNMEREEWDRFANED